MPYNATCWFHIEQKMYVKVGLLIRSKLRCMDQTNSTVHHTHTHIYMSTVPQKHGDELHEF